MLIRACFLSCLCCLGLQAWGQDFPGSASLNLSDEPVAGKSLNAELVFRSDIDLPRDSRIAIHQHWQDDVRLQHDNPKAVAWLEASAPEGISLMPFHEEVPESGPVPTPKLVGYSIADSSLPAGSEIIFNISALPLPEVAGYPFTLIVQVQQPDEPWMKVPPGEPFVVLPGDLARITASARSFVNTREDINLQVRMEDEFGNLVIDRELSLDLRVNGVFKQRADMNTAVTRISGIRFKRQGNYWVELFSAGRGLRAVANPVRVGYHNRDLLWVDFAPVTSASTGYLSRKALLDAGAGRFDLILPADHSKLPPELSNGDNERARLFRQGNKHHVRILDEAGSVIDVAVPEVPADMRFLSLETVKLVQVVAGKGQHFWLGEQFAERGFPVGFVGSNYSMHYPGSNPGVFTAVLAENNDWFQAMAEGRTYVSIGEKIILMPIESRLAMTPVRTVGFDVMATGPIEQIILFKNGKVIDRRTGEEQVETEYLLEVYSDSKPFSTLGSPPRNAREWVGYITANDTNLTAVPQADWYLSQRGGARRVDFFTKTHGSSQYLRISPGKTTTDTLLEIVMADGYEDEAWIPKDRVPQPIPLKKFLIPIAEAETGATRISEVIGYLDRVNIRPARSPMGSEFNYLYTDRDVPKVGDYYYLAVIQQNGARAWSSPIHVGL